MQNPPLSIRPKAVLSGAGLFGCCHESLQASRASTWRFQDGGARRAADKPMRSEGRVDQDAPKHKGGGETCPSVPARSGSRHRPTPSLRIDPP